MSPYVGDGSLCVLDSDSDGYPDFALRTCSENDEEIYCSTDSCRYAPNTDQSDTSQCEEEETGMIELYVHIIMLCHIVCVFVCACV